MFLKRYILLCLKEDDRKLSRNSSGRLHFVLNLKYKRYLCIENGNCDLVYYQIIHDIKFFISKLSEQLCFAQIQDVKETKTGIEGVILLDETVTKQSSLLSE